MTILKNLLATRITAHGPMTIATYMAECLGHAEHGYYMKQDPFGAKGDFTTAPEVSQLFGEMLGLWCGQNWLDMGRPERIHLIELGPGRGTLMADILRSLKVIPGMIDALTVHLVEMSPALRKIQEKKLTTYKATWHHQLGEIFGDIKGEPILLVANEFFDALPIQQFQKNETGWQERLVGLDNARQLSIELAPTPDSHIIYKADAGEILEICPVGESIFTEIASYTQDHGGVALIIDYGHDCHGTGDTLQAVKNHQYVDILSDPGNVDLTAHVNFQILREIALNHALTVSSPITQGTFLKSLGIEVRAEKLMANASKAQKKDIAMALHRLTDDDQMGQLFKVMTIRGRI